MENQTDQWFCGWLCVFGEPMNVVSCQAITSLLKLWPIKLWPIYAYKNNIEFWISLLKSHNLVIVELTILHFTIKWGKPNSKMLVMGCYISVINTFNIVTGNIILQLKVCLKKGETKSLD